MAKKGGVIDGEKTGSGWCMVMSPHPPLQATETLKTQKRIILFCVFCASVAKNRGGINDEKEGCRSGKYGRIPESC